MNWDIVKWIAGVLLTFAGVKFVWVAFRAIFSKDNMTNVLENIGDRCSDAAYEGGEFMRRKMVEHKKRRQAKKDEKDGKVIAYIR